ncbi:MAG: tRNA (cytidine(34)-2'-O)-methyltransferase [Bacilli bacterium]|jgi:tRNA (cytidine/uridine-2'-O-)-methyltransferase|nr:tRNA (cytidine(34)-2'-O)-methyltransferase [Bacilli bacterium]
MIHIVLFEPEKPANVGNIIRTCMAFSCSLTIIGPLSFDLSDKALKRAGMDYMIGFPLERFLSLDDFYLKRGKEKIFYVTRYSKNIYSQADFSDVATDLYLMFGRESTGIPHDILRANYPYTLRIPMAPEARSLNLADSVALVLGEAERQRKFFGLATREAIKGEDFLFKEAEEKENWK